MAKAFVIRPFGKKKDSSGKEIDFDHIHKELIGPALKTAKLEGETTGEIVDSGNIREDMFALILEADLVICDITVHNANVFYELGIRHSLRKKRTILIKGQPTEDGTPFDLLTDRYFPYNIENPAAAKDELIRTIHSSLKSDRPTDSPIFQMLPSLPEADPSKGKIVSVDFTEEVKRAQAAESKGWLRLLSDEVRKSRFHWEGLKIVGKAQWDLKDWEGAKDSWEAIREMYPSDIDSNCALANIYERLYRVNKRLELLETSDQAIERMLANERATRKQRTEALTLQARNEKTRWRLEFAHSNTTEERRKAAMNRALIHSYEHYREAFLKDLNHFWPGLAALQMGTILVDFTEHEFWYDAFDTDSEAKAYKRKLEAEVQALYSLIPVSIEAALSQIDKGDPDRYWAEISDADMLFLTTERENRAIGAYSNAIPLDKPFAWDAARGQLKLFADLGIKEKLALKVIEKVDARFKQYEKKQSKSREKSDKPIHLVVFAGHRIDSPNRAAPRFPASKEKRVKELIQKELEDLVDDKYELAGLASAAPGADIIAHEVFDELGLPSTICLPMPVDDFSRLVFEDLDNWRIRYLDLIQNKKALELSDKEGLPRWLYESKMDPWERGNRWVLNMALTWDAGRITLVTLWDGKNIGDAPGGTAHMVQLARDSGTIRIKHIKTEELLN